MLLAARDWLRAVVNTVMNLLDPLSDQQVLHGAISSILYYTIYI
jgi:hypothetical protein